MLPLRLEFCLRHVLIVAQVHFLFFDGANHPFCLSVFARFANASHADLHDGVLQLLDIASCSICERKCINSRALLMIQRLTQLPDQRSVPLLNRHPLPFRVSAYEMAKGARRTHCPFRICWFVSVIRRYNHSLLRFRCKVRRPYPAPLESPLRQLQPSTGFGPKLHWRPEPQQKGHQHQNKN